MTQTDFTPTLDLRGALALFLLLDRRGSGTNADLDALDRSVRSYLYERLSIAEMEDPEALYRTMLAGRGESDRIR